MRIRMEFHRGRELKFVSHLDTLKTFERAMRRADVPLAFSEGFNPHPKMSFATALAVGITSAKEYMDIETAEDVDTEQLKISLNNALPKGMQIETAIAINKSLPALMATVNRAKYQVIIGISDPITNAELQTSITNLLKMDEVVITKKTKKGNKEKNIRPGIEQLSGETNELQIVLEMLLHTGETTVRPEEAIQALINFGQLNINISHTNIHKEGLFILQGENLFSPIDSAVL